MAWAEIEGGAGVWIWRYNVAMFGPANSIAVRLSDGKIVVLSPPNGVPDSCFEELELHGAITMLVVPNGGHVRGQNIWQSRYPDARIFAPVSALSFLDKPGLRPALALSKFPNSNRVVFSEIPGTKKGGTLLVIQRGRRPIVYLDEIIGNQAKLPGLLILKLLFWATRSAPGIKKNGVFTTLLCNDAGVAATTVLASLDEETIIIPAHGAPIADPEGIAAVFKLLRTTAKE